MIFKIGGLTFVTQTISTEETTKFLMLSVLPDIPLFIYSSQTQKEKQISMDLIKT